jgi:hypothetical protein
MIGEVGHHAEMALKPAITRRYSPFPYPEVPEAAGGMAPMGKFRPTKIIEFLR